MDVLFHDVDALDEQAREADRVGLVLPEGFNDGADRLLDADVEDLVAVVGQDDVNQVLADVVHVALDGGEHDLALLLALHSLHEGFELRHGHLHDLGALEHERQLHLARAEQFADGLHALEQVVVDDASGL
jgi:hypothetical protein